MKPPQPCPYCGHYHAGVCPLVRAFEYWEDGVTLKRVEFHGPVVAVPQPALQLRDEVGQRCPTPEWR